MNSVRSRLEALLAWVRLHSCEIEDYLLAYPYVQYRQIDCTSILKAKVNEVIDLIISLIRQGQFNNDRKDNYGENGVRSAGEANLLCRIKINLEQIRYSFLAIRQLKTVNTAHIINTLQEAIHLATSEDCQPNPDTSDYRSRNRSDYISEQTQRKGMVPLNRYTQNGVRRFDEKHRTDKIKEELHGEMGEYLKRKSLGLSQQRQKRMRLDRTNGEVEKNSKEHNFDKNIQKKSVDNRMLTKEAVPRRPKKKYAYLEDYQRSIGTVPQEKQYKSQTNTNQYESPQDNLVSEDKYKSLQSTGPRTTPQVRSLEDEMPELKENPAELLPLERQIDFGPKLSQIKPRLEVSGEPWEQFMEDSMDRQIEEAVNSLQDSLEMMKDREKLNQTGTFKIPVGLTQQFNQYSFGQE